MLLKRKICSAGRGGLCSPVGRDKNLPLGTQHPVDTINTKPLGDRSQETREMLLCLLRNIGLWVHLSWEEGVSLEGTLGSRRIEVLAQEGVI